MHRDFVICLIMPAGKRIRQAAVSRGFILAVGAAVLVGLATVGIGCRSIFDAKEKGMEVQRLETVIALQRKTILLQRGKIRRFAVQLSDLGSGLEKLRRLETQVRILADLDRDAPNSAKIGIGGGVMAPMSMPAASGIDTASLLHRMDRAAAALDNAAEERARSLASLVSGLTEKFDLLSATPSIRPTQGWKTSGFGYRVSPFTGRREPHRALDIANDPGTPILATADGVVARTASAWPSGKHLVIDHGYGMTTVYAHVNRFLKKTGDRVRRGETIALMGSTGRSTGPHLHYEVRLDGVPVDPEEYILN